MPPLADCANDLQNSLKSNPGRHAHRDRLPPRIHRTSARVLLQVHLHLLVQLRVQFLNRLATPVENVRGNQVFHALLVPQLDGSCNTTQSMVGLVSAFCPWEEMKGVRVVRVCSEKLRCM